MEIVAACCCGLDVDKKSIVACLRSVDCAGRLHKEVRSFGTMTEELLALAAWLKAAGCTHVAMESTGVFWKPIFNVLHDQFEVIVVNAQHINGMVISDKFCMTRWSTLVLSWRRGPAPRSAT